MWIVRDKDGTLVLYATKPKLYTDSWRIKSPFKIDLTSHHFKIGATTSNRVELPYDDLPLSFENSPKELVINWN